MIGSSRNISSDFVQEDFHLAMNIPSPNHTMAHAVPHMIVAEDPTSMVPPIGNEDENDNIW